MCSESVNALTVNQSVKFASFGALAVQIWEFVNSFFDEAEYLWRSRFTLVKLLYVWSRYVPLVGQIVNLALTQIDEVPSNGLSCVGIFVYKTVMAQQTLTCVEIILLIRVYALYNQSRRVKYFLCTIFLAACVLEIWSSGRIIVALMMGKSCIPAIIPFASVITFCASASCYQGLILCMTLFKYFVGHHGRARTPLTSLILREGIMVCFLTFGLLIINATDGGIRMAGLRLGNAEFAWYISLLSVVGCRLILDMRKLAVSDENYWNDYEIDLTSNLDLASHHSIVSTRLGTGEHSAQ